MPLHKGACLRVQVFMDVPFYYFWNMSAWVVSLCFLIDFGKTSFILKISHTFLTPADPIVMDLFVVTNRSLLQD